jgi:hypothetical protein
MEMCQEHSVYRSDGHADLCEPDRGSTTYVEQQFLVASLYQCRRAEPIKNRGWRSRAEKGDLKILCPCP